MHTVAILLASLTLTCGTLLGVNPPVTPDGIGGYWQIKGSRVIKTNADARELSSYSNIRLGDPHSIDAAEPFRIMVFYLEAQSIVILNSDAAPLGPPLNLNTIIHGNATLACKASRGGIYVLHQQAGEIVHIDNQMSPSGHRILLGTEDTNSNPTWMVEAGGTIYIGIDGKQIVRVNTYGSTLRPLIISYDPLHRFRVQPPYLWVKRNGKNIRYNLNKLGDSPTQFSCPCPGLPFSAKGEVYCYGSKGIEECSMLSDP